MVLTCPDLLIALMKYTHCRCHVGNTYPECSICVYGSEFIFLYNSFFEFPSAISLIGDILYVYPCIHVMYAVEIYQDIYSFPVLLLLLKKILSLK